MKLILVLTLLSSSVYAAVPVNRAAVAVRAAPAPSPQQVPTPNLTISANAGDPTSALDSILSEDYIRALRDPFRPPTQLSLLMARSKKEAPKSDLEAYPLKEFKLNGVIATKKKVQAMLTAPNGKGYFVSVGERLGVREGKVSAILSESVKIVEYEIDDKGRRVPEIFELKMNGELVSLSDGGN